jgi:hypothetical protein
MIDKFEPTPRSELNLEEAVRTALSRSGIGDTSNNFHGVRMLLDVPKFWPRLARVQTYEQYILDKYAQRQDIAKAVIERTDKTFIADYDTAAQRINDSIGSGIQDKEQAEQVRALCVAAQKVVSDFCSKI